MRGCCLLSFKAQNVQCITICEDVYTMSEMSPTSGDASDITFVLHEKFESLVSLEKKIEKYSEKNYILCTIETQGHSKTR